MSANDLKAQVKAAWTTADVLPRVDRASEGKVRCLNPDGHEHGDENPSAVVYPDRLWCPVCKKKWDVIALYMVATGLAFNEALMAMARERGIPIPEKRAPRKDKKGEEIGTLERTYDYRDEAGVLLYQAVRFRDPKGFRQRRPDEKKAGGWVWSLKGVRRVLYRLPDLLATDPEAWVFVVEGEKDVENLVALGLVSTCNAMGAGKWLDSYSESLTGRRVVIIPDHDKPGRDHADMVARSLHGVAEDVRVVDLGMKEDGADVSDWLTAGGTKAHLLELVEAAPSYVFGGAGKPQILLAPGRLLQVLNECESALVRDRSRDPIFDLNGRGTVCRVSRLRTRQTFQKAITREARTLLISVLDERQAVQRLMRAAGFLKYDKTGDLVPADCSERVGAHFIHQGRYERLPLLTGIIGAPTIRPDGTLLDTPGYDDATGLVLDAMPDEFPSISTSPTRRDAEAALAIILDLLCEFPYASESDRAAGVAALLTALLRRCMNIAPAFSFDAPDMSSGKTTHAHVAAMLATGRSSSVLAWPETEEERRKSLFSLLLAGDQCAVIDNVDKPMQSGIFCSLVTSPEHTDRILGGSRKATVSTAVTWMITGNNLRLVGDLTSRVVPCRLNPRHEFAENRVFKRDIHTYVLQHRGEIVRAALTVVLAYLRSDEPVVVPGCRFPQWSRMVREPLIWLGLTDPMEGTRRLRRDDMERERLSNLMAPWAHAFADAPVALRDVIARAKTDEVLSDALRDVATSARTKDLDTRTLGYYLRSKRGKVVDGRSFEPAEGSGHGGVGLWILGEVASNPGQTISSISTISTKADAATGGDGGDGGHDPGRSGSGSGRDEPAPVTRRSRRAVDPDDDPDSGLAGYIEDPEDGGLWSDDQSGGTGGNR